MKTRMIGNSLSFAIFKSIVMYLDCLPSFGITFSCFLIVPGYSVVPTEIEDSGMQNFGAKQGVLWEMPNNEFA